jgi:hypothetical protein
VATPPVVVVVLTATVEPPPPPPAPPRIVPLSFAKVCLRAARHMKKRRQFIVVSIEFDTYNPYNIHVTA